MKGAHKWAEFTQIVLLPSPCYRHLVTNTPEDYGMLPELGHSFSETKETEGGSPDAVGDGSGGITRRRRPERKPRRMTWHPMGY